MCVFFSKEISPFGFSIHKYLLWPANVILLFCSFIHRHQTLGRQRRMNRDSAVYGKRQTNHRNPRSHDCNTGVCTWLWASHSSAYSSCLLKLCSLPRPLPPPRAHLAGDLGYRRGRQTAARAAAGCCLSWHSPPVKNELHSFKWLQGKIKSRIDEIQIPVFTDSCTGT